MWPFIFQVLQFPALQFPVLHYPVLQFQRPHLEPGFSVAVHVNRNWQFSSDQIGSVLSLTTGFTRNWTELNWTERWVQFSPVQFVCSVPHTYHVRLLHKFDKLQTYIKEMTKLDRA